MLLLDSKKDCDKMRTKEFLESEKVEDFKRVVFSREVKNQLLSFNTKHKTYFQ